MWRFSASFYPAHPDGLHDQSILQHKSQDFACCGCFCFWLCCHFLRHRSRLAQSAWQRLALERTQCVPPTPKVRLKPVSRERTPSTETETAHP
jgi:hypothetical protein